MFATDDACRIPKEIISTRKRFGYPQRTADVCEIRPRKDKRGVDFISDALPFGRLWYGEPDAISNAIGHAKFSSRSPLNRHAVVPAARLVVAASLRADTRLISSKKQALALVAPMPVVLPT